MRLSRTEQTFCILCKETAFSFLSSWFYCGKPRSKNCVYGVSSREPTKKRAFQMPGPEECRTNMSRKLLASLALSVGALTTACWGQTLPAPLDFTRSNAEGIRIYNVSTFFGYTRSDFPTMGQPVVSNARQIYGVMGTLGWQRFRGRTNFTLRYTGMYTGDVHQAELNRFNHNVIFGLVREFGRKWDLSVSGNAQQASFYQYLFEPTPLGAVAQTPATFDNLAASMSVGGFTSSRDGLQLTPAVAVSPIRAALLSAGLWTYAARAGLSYSPNSRLRFSFGSFAVGGQFRSGNQIPELRQAYFLPNTFSGDATVSFSINYTVSPRTIMDVSLSQTYIATRFQKATATNGMYALGRKMGRNWFLRGNIGVFYSEYQSGWASPRAQTIGGASIGFTTYGNTFLASYNRTGYDFNFNAGALGANTIISGAWQWRRPRSDWGFNAGYNRIQSSTPGFTGLSGWQTNAGFTQRLPANLFVNATYTHLSSRGVYLSLNNQITIDGARIMIGWAPRGVRRNATGVLDPDID